MRQMIAALLLAGMPLALQAADSGLQTRTSPYPVGDTLDRLESVLRTKGIKIFARIDHSAEAQAVGLSLPPTQLLIFGNPKAGTPLMQASPSVGLDLPMKILVSQNSQGQAQVTWNTADYLIQRHGLAPSMAPSLNAIAGLIDAALK